MRVLNYPKSRRDDPGFFHVCILVMPGLLAIGWIEISNFVGKRPVVCVMLSGLTVVVLALC